MRYDESVIKNVMDSSDIVAIISEYTVLTKKGSSYVGCCPFHNEKTPSFYVNPEKGLYNCFGCHAGGNVVKFLREKENVDFLTAIKMLADKAHITLPEEPMSEAEQKILRHKKRLFDINREAANYYYVTLRKEYGDEGRKYLTQVRGLSEEIQKSFALGYSPNNMNGLIPYLKKKGYTEKEMEQAGVVAKSQKGNHYDKFFGRVIFPIQDVNDNVIGFGGRILGGEGAKYMNTPETEIFKKRENLFALNKAKKSRRDEIIMVEGNMDVVSLHEAGFDNTVASLGTALTYEQARLLKKYKHNVILLYDSDSAGIEATFKAIPILRDASFNVKVLNVKDAKDPDEYIKKFGKDKFEELLGTALSYIEYELNVFGTKYNLADAYDKKEYIDKALERVKDIKSEIDRELYLEKLSDRVIIEKSILRKRLSGELKDIFAKERLNESKEVDTGTIVGEKRSQKSLQNEEKQKQLISIMINHQNLFFKMRKYIKTGNMETRFLSDLLMNIYNWYDEYGEIDISNILNKYEDLEDSNLIVAIVAMMKKTKLEDAKKIADKLLKENLMHDIDNELEECKDKMRIERNQVELQELSRKMQELTNRKFSVNKKNILED